MRTKVRSAVTNEDRRSTDSDRDVLSLEPMTPPPTMWARLDATLLGRAEKPVLVMFGVLGMLFAMADDAAPTGWGTADLVWRVLGGAVTVGAAVFAGPGFTLVAAIGAAAAAGNIMLFVLAALGVVASTVAFRLLAAHERLLCGFAGLTTSIVIFRLSYTDFLGLATVIALAIGGVVVAGAVYYGPPDLVRGMRIAAGVATAALLIGVAVVAYAAWRSRNAVADAVTAADEAADHFRDGDDAAARRSLSRAVELLDDANGRFQNPLVKAMRVVPVLAHHTHAGTTLLGGAAATAAVAEDLLADLDRDQLAVTEGKIDISVLVELEPTLIELTDELDRLEAAITEVDNPWLLPPVRDELASARIDLDDIRGGISNATEAVSVAPDMLGKSGPRSYLVLVATPAEARGTVGLLGNWALITADGGQLALDRVGRVEDLNRVLRTLDVSIDEPTRYVESYGAFNIERQMQDVTLSPDFPDVAAVARQLFAEAQGIEVDAVILADPETIAALLKFTGPIEVDGRQVSSNTVVDLLLVGQYEEFDEVNRVLFLGRLLEETFDAVFDADLGNAWRLKDDFEDVVAEDRFAVWPVDPAEQAVMETLGLTAAFPVADGDDFVAVVAQNAGQNKIDSFMARSITYETEISPSGAFSATLTLEATNRAKSADLAPAIIGSNDQGLAPGTNRQRLVFYTQHDVVDARINAFPLGLQGSQEFGLHRWTALVDIAPGATVTIQLDISGTLDLSDGYRLHLPLQAGVNDDLVTVNVDGGGDWLIANSTTAWRSQQRTSQDLVVDLTSEFVTTDPIDPTQPTQTSEPDAPDS